MEQPNCQTTPKFSQARNDLTRQKLTQKTMPWDDTKGLFESLDVVLEVEACEIWRKMVANFLN